MIQMGPRSSGVLSRSGPWQWVGARVPGASEPEQEVERQPLRAHGREGPSFREKAPPIPPGLDSPC